MGINGAQNSRLHPATIDDAWQQAVLITNGPGPGAYVLPLLWEINGNGGDFEPAIPPRARKLDANAGGKQVNPVADISPIGGSKWDAREWRVQIRHGNVAIADLVVSRSAHTVSERIAL